MAGARMPAWVLVMAVELLPAAFAVPAKPMAVKQQNATTLIRNFAGREVIPRFSTMSSKLPP
ncbi:MAG: hypothetical protein ABWZ98_18225 [Nakamurella sp.]